MIVLKHKWHPEHRRLLFQSINGIRYIENILKHKWHPEHRKPDLPGLPSGKELEVYFKLDRFDLIQ